MIEFAPVACVEPASVLKFSAIVIYLSTASVKCMFSTRTSPAINGLAFSGSDSLETFSDSILIFPDRDFKPILLKEMNQHRDFVQV